MTALVLLMVGCKTIEYVPVTVTEHHTDTAYIHLLQRDSIYLHDSVSVYQQGETIRIDRWHTKYVSREVHDTLYQHLIDSVPVPYPVERLVPAQLSGWQNFRIWLGNILLAALGVGIVATLFYKKFQKV